MASYEEQDFDQANDLVKTRQRYLRRPKRSAELLSKLMARKGYNQTESSNELDDAWKAIVDPKWQSRTKVGIIRNGILEIVVSSSAINQQLEFQKSKLLSEMQSRLPQNKLKDLRFKVGKVPT